MTRLWALIELLALTLALTGTVWAFADAIPWQMDIEAGQTRAWLAAHPGVRVAYEVVR